MARVVDREASLEFCQDMTSQCGGVSVRSHRLCLNNHKMCGTLHQCHSLGEVLG